MYIKIDGKASEKLNKFFKDNKGKKCAIIIGDKVYTVIKIGDIKEKERGRVTITGFNDIRKVKDLKVILEMDKLPVKLKLISIKQESKKESGRTGGGG